MTECSKVSDSEKQAHIQAPSNTRINILFMLDSFLANDFQTNPEDVEVYRRLAARDLPSLVDMVVPTDSWDAVINAGSTRQVSLYTSTLTS